jgi:histidinol-phosphatase
VTISQAPLNDDLALAMQMADLGDQMTMQKYRADDLVVDTKPDLTPVTEADRATELALREFLAQHRPDDAVRGEEFDDTATAARTWVLDPIDGTKNYVRGVPVWATLIGLMVGDEVVIGVVSAPAMGRRWWAQAGEGAYTRDVDGSTRPIHVSAVGSLEDSSFSYSDHIGWDHVGAADLDCSAGFNELQACTWRSRAYGDFWSHMLVAEGAVDIAAEPGLMPWDIAALVAVVVAAGGKVTGFDGSAPVEAGCALSTNGLLHDQALRTLNS